MICETASKQKLRFNSLKSRSQKFPPVTELISHRLDSILEQVNLSTQNEQTSEMLRPLMERLEENIIDKYELYYSLVINMLTSYA